VNNCKYLRTICALSIAFFGSIANANAASAVATTAETSTVFTAAKVMYTNANAKVRSKPSTSAKVVKTLPKGTKVIVTAVQNGWSKVSGGWIRNDLLTSTKPNGASSESVDVSKLKGEVSQHHSCISSNKGQIWYSDNFGHEVAGEIISPDSYCN